MAQFVSPRGQQDFKREEITSLLDYNEYNLYDVLYLYNNYMKRFFILLCTAQDKGIASGIEELMVWRERNFSKEIGFDMCIYNDTQTYTHKYTKHPSPLYTVQVGISSIKKI